MGNWSDEETDEPLIADHRNFYKVEKWSRDGERVTELLFAGQQPGQRQARLCRWQPRAPGIMSHPGGFSTPGLPVRR